jgi:hypothetical protein
MREDRSVCNERRRKNAKKGCARSRENAKSDKKATKKSTRDKNLSVGRASHSDVSSSLPGYIIS